MGFSGETTIGEGGKRVLKAGEFEKLIFEGKELSVLSKKIENGGFISTRDFGKIKIEFAGWNIIHMYLTPSQKKKFLGFKKRLLNE